MLPISTDVRKQVWKEEMLIDSADTFEQIEFTRPAAIIIFVGACILSFLIPQYRIERSTQHMMEGDGCFTISRLKLGHVPGLIECEARILRASTTKRETSQTFFNFQLYGTTSADVKLNHSFSENIFFNERESLSNVIRIFSSRSYQSTSFAANLCFDGYSGVISVSSSWYISSRFMTKFVSFVKTTSCIVVVVVAVLSRGKGIKTMEMHVSLILSVLFALNILFGGRSGRSFIGATVGAICTFLLTTGIRVSSFFFLSQAKLEQRKSDRDELMRYVFWGLIFLLEAVACFKFAKGRFSRDQVQNDMLASRWECVADVVIVMALLYYTKETKHNIDQSQVFKMGMYTKLCLSVAVICMLMRISSGWMLSSPLMLIPELNLTIAQFLYVVLMLVWHRPIAKTRKYGLIDEQKDDKVGESLVFAEADESDSEEE